MNIFITGATGFVGRNLLTYLTDTQPEAEITCLVRSRDKALAQWPQTPRNVRWLEGDLLAPASYRTAAGEADLVFHTAALVGLRNGAEFYAQNTQATRHLVEALRGSERLSRLVFTGSISAVDRPWDQRATGPLTEQSPCQPRTDYGKSKLQAEKLIIESGLPYTVMIPAYIYGPHPRPNSSMDRLIRDMLAGKSYTRFPFPGAASEIYVEDLAEALWIAATHPNTLNRRFFIANPAPVRVADAYQTLAEALERPLEPLRLSPEQMARYETRWRTAQPENLLLRILFEDYFACSSEAWVQATGHPPRFGMREGVIRTVEWYRGQGII